MDRGSQTEVKSREMKTVLVASLGLVVLIAACSSGGGGGGDKIVTDGGDDAAVDHPAGDASGDRGGTDRIADAGADGILDAPAADAPAADAPVADGAYADAARDAGPATPIAVQVPLASAPTVGAWHASCVVSDTDTTGTSTCWVIQWRQWTYWALSNTDNRNAFLIVGVDAAGNLKSAGVERSGARYLWQATVDGAAMTVSYAGQGGVVTLSWADLDEEPPPSPEASEAAIELAPTVAGGWYASCVYGPNDFTLVNTCPVIKWGQWTYWALSNSNNDQALNIVAVDAHGAVNSAGGLIKNGTRYVWKLTVDATADGGADGGAGTATFYGQASNTVTVTFDELRIDQP